jgi:hypothetical protein
VCAFKSAIARDVREFLAADPDARLIELDTLVDLAQYRKRVVATEPVAANKPAPSPAADLREDASGERPIASRASDRDRYVAAMQRFMRERGVTEIFLGPFNSWLRGEFASDPMTPQALGQVVEELKAIGALWVENRVATEGHRYAVMVPSFEHPLFRAAVAA